MRPNDAKFVPNDAKVLQKGANVVQYDAKLNQFLPQRTQRFTEKIWVRLGSFFCEAGLRLEALVLRIKEVSAL